jgi:hypothetical protein
MGRSLIAALFLLSIGGSRCHIPAGQATQASRRLCGVDLSPDAAALAAQIEARYQVPIVESPDGVPMPGLSAMSIVNDNGMPSIHWDPQHPLREADVVHELLHLRLKLEGYPVAFKYAIGPTNRDPTDGEAEMLRTYQVIGYSPLEHALFNHEMVTRGYDPDGDLRKAVREFTIRDASTVASLYARVGLEATTPQIRAEIEGIMRSSQPDESIKRGERLASMIADCHPTTPEGVVTAYAAYLSAFATTVRYSFAGWIDVNAHNNTFKVGRIRVTSF